MLHEVPAGIVGDEGVGHAVAGKLPRGEQSLVARARLVHPDVDGNALVVRHEDGGRDRAPVDGGHPAGVAVGEDVDAALRVREFALDERQAMAPDGFVQCHVLVGDRLGFLPGGLAPSSVGQVLQARPHAPDGP